MDPETGRLFALATKGDTEALDDLLVRYLPQLHAFVHARLGPGLRRRESSADVVQSICRSLLAAPDAPSFHEEERFRAWLFTCALNKVREKHRRHHGELRDLAREEHDVDHDAMVALASLHTPSQVAVGKESVAAIRKALAELSEEHREVITLARLVELPHRVIAEVMGRSEEATRQLLSRALLALMRTLRARGIDLENEARQ